MSWRELERLVHDAERQAPLRQALRCCQGTEQLLLRARTLGYRITRVDLQRAVLDHQQQLLQRQQQRRSKGGVASC